MKGLEQLLDTLEEPTGGSGSHMLIADRILTTLVELKEIAEEESSIKVANLKCFENLMQRTKKAAIMLYNTSLELGSLTNAIKALHMQSLVW